MEIDETKGERVAGIRAHVQSMLINQRFHGSARVVSRDTRRSHPTNPNSPRLRFFLAETRRATWKRDPKDILD